MGAKDKLFKRRGANRDICRENISEGGLAVDLQSQRLWMIQIQSLSGTRRPCVGDLVMRKGYRLGL
jgi:hypothetical protein